MSDSIPDSPEAITPEWLDTALATSLPGLEVASVEVLDRHSGTTGRARLGLRYASGSAGSDTLFVKLPPFDATQRQLVAVTDMARREPLTGHPRRRHLHVQLVSGGAATQGRGRLAAAPRDADVRRPRDPGSLPECPLAR